MWISNCSLARFMTMCLRSSSSWLHAASLTVEAAWTACHTRKRLQLTLGRMLLKATEMSHARCVSCK
jgi:hypothetical protein